MFLGKDILPTVQAFLDLYPSEIVILCVNHEFGLGGHSNDTPNSQGLDFDGLLHELFMKGVTPNRLYDQQATPRLADVRGCVVLMRRDANASFGILAMGWPNDGKGVFPAPPPGPQFSAQDAYSYNLMEDALAAKWRNVLSQLNAAVSGSDGALWYLNFTSASNAPAFMPSDYALDKPGLSGVNYSTISTLRYELEKEDGGPHQLGENYQLYGYLCEQVSPQRFGTIVMDYPEYPAGLIKLLISMNSLRQA